MNTWNGDITRDRSNITFSIFSYFSFLAMVIAMLLGGAVFGLLSGGLFGNLGHYVVGGVIITIVMAILIGLRQDELAVMLLLMLQLYVDWYLQLLIVGKIITLALLLAFYLARSSRHPWAKPRGLWLWTLFLVLAIPPAIQGATSNYNTAYYYPNMLFGALIVFWLGTVIARNTVCVQRLCVLLAFFGTLVALHTIIQETTGTVLFRTTQATSFLMSKSQYLLPGSDSSRAGSFFIDPNWNGTFLAIMLFFPLGLFVTSSSFLEKALYLVEAFLILLALFFTYSTGAFIGAFAGFIAFVIFVGYTRYRVLLPLLIIASISVVMTLFPSQVSLQLQHALNTPSDYQLRIGAWETGLRVIQAFPLTGIGLSLDSYLQRAEPYRVPTQYIPLAHPHNSYLELGAMAGLPVLVVFIVLLVYALWRALHNWSLADVRTRSLFASGLAAIVALSVNSWSINGWTLPPLAALGWLILGILSSSLLSKNLGRAVVPEKYDNSKSNA